MLLLYYLPVFTICLMYYGDIANITEQIPHQLAFQAQPLSAPLTLAVPPNAVSSCLCLPL